MQATPEQTDTILQQRFGKYTSDLRKLFEQTYPGKHPLDLLNLDTIFRIPTKNFVCSFAQAGGTAYSYLFALEFPYQQGKIAWHCADIPFVFHNIDLAPVANIPNVSDRLQDQIFGAVIQFARTGNPNHSGLPEWPASSADHEATMILDRECRLGCDFDDQLLELYASATPKFDLMALMSAMADSDIQH